MGSAASIKVETTTVAANNASEPLPVKRNRRTASAGSGGVLREGLVPERRGLGSPTTAGRRARPNEGRGDRVEGGASQQKVFRARQARRPQPQEDRRRTLDRLTGGLRKELLLEFVNYLRLSRREKKRVVLTPGLKGISYLLGRLGCARESETGLHARHHRKRALFTIPLLLVSRRIPCRESPYRADDFAGSGQLIQDPIGARFRRPFKVCGVEASAQD